jgi:hypothetical protein
MKSEREEFSDRIVKASALPEAKSRPLAERLWMMRFRSERLAVAKCNRELTEEEKALGADLDARVEAIGKELGLKAYRQDDPRGNTIRVEVGQEFADNWDGLTVGCG